MRYLKNYESHKFSNTNTEPVNEEILGALGKMFGNLFKKVKERINKTRGGKEVEAIYQKFLKKIQDDLSKQADVDLNIVAGAAEASGEAPKAEAKPAEAKKESLSKKTESEKIFEADDVDTKMRVEALKKKTTLLTQIVNKYKEMALKEMDNVLNKMGGSQKNPQLAIIIQAKKDEFDIAFMNAQISYLEKSGDKVLSAEVSKKRDAIAKKVEGTYKNFDTAKPVEFKDGDEVIYLLKGKTKDDWNKLTDDEKKKPTEGKAKEVVGVHKIVKMEGDKYTLEDKDGKPTIVKTGAEIVGKSAANPGEEKTETAAEQQDLAKKLGEMKTKKPEDMTKVSNYVDFISDEKNKDKVAEIEKIMSETK